MNKIDNLNKIIGDKVWKYRVEMGISRNEIAKHLGISHQQFEKYEKGLNRISAGALSVIMQYLSVRPEQFFEDLEFSKETPAQRKMCREISQNFMNIQNPRFRRLMIITSKMLAEEE